MYPQDLLNRCCDPQAIQQFLFCGLQSPVATGASSASAAVRNRRGQRLAPAPPFAYRTRFSDTRTPPLPAHPTLTTATRTRVYSRLSRIALLESLRFLISEVTARARQSRRDRFRNGSLQIMRNSRVSLVGRPRQWVAPCGLIAKTAQQPHNRCNHRAVARRSSPCPIVRPCRRLPTSARCAPKSIEL